MIDELIHPENKDLFKYIPFFSIGFLSNDEKLL